MTLKPTIAVSDDGLLFNPATGDSFSANPLAAVILRALRAGQTPAAVRADLLARYDVTPARLAADWDDLTAQLRSFGLLLPGDDAAAPVPDVAPAVAHEPVLVN